MIDSDIKQRLLDGGMDDPAEWAALRDGLLAEGEGVDAGAVRERLALVVLHQHPGDGSIYPPAASTPSSAPSTPVKRMTPKIHFWGRLRPSHQSITRAQPSFELAPGPKESEVM